MRISDWSSDVCSSDLEQRPRRQRNLAPFRCVEHGPAAAVGGELGFAAHRLALAAAVEAADEEAIAPAVLGFPRRQAPAVARSEERRVGKECVRTCRSRWSSYP